MYEVYYSRGNNVFLGNTKYNLKDEMPNDSVSGGATKLIICMENTSKDINPYAPSDAPWHKYW